MLRHLLLVAFLLLALAAGLPGDEPPRLIMISIDGLMPDAYAKSSPAKIPRLRRLAAEGAFARLVGVLPTVTYPSHTTLITGVPPAVHGIIDNRFVDPEGRARGAWYWYAALIQVTTLPGAVRARGLTAAGVSWPVTVGMDLDYRVPEFPRSDHPENLLLLGALSTPRHVLQAAEAFRGRPFGWPQKDRDRTDLARFFVHTYRPHLLLVHLIDLDAAQHREGPGSPEALATLERIDGYVGEVLETVQQAGLTDRTYIAIVSDHGFRRLERELQPNALFKSEGLIRTNDRNVIVDWQAYFHSSGGAGFVYLKDPRDMALQKRVGDLLGRLRADPANGIDIVWDRAALDTMGAHPDATFGLSMAPGFYTAAGRDVLLRPSSNRGGHGFDPTKPELHASFILRGPGLKRTGDFGVVRMTQAAPTLAKLLGVSLSPRADQPLPID